MIIEKIGNEYVATGNTFGLQCAGRGKNQLEALLEWVYDAIRRLEGGDPLNANTHPNGANTADRRQQGVQ